MCPACFSTATIIIAGTVSGGSLTALAIAIREKLSGRKNISNTNQNQNHKELIIEEK